MASMWIWLGSKEGLEKVAFEDMMVDDISGTERERGQPHTNNQISKLSADDAVILNANYRIADERRISCGWLLNRGAARAARMSAAERQHIWRRAGLSSGKQLQSERLFRVSIVHLELVALQRVDAAGKSVNGRPLLPLHAAAGQDAGSYGGGWPADAALRRVVRAAVQALYALGLDIGEAEVAIGGDGRIAVRDAWPMLRDSQLEATALQRFAAWYAAVRAGKAVSQLDHSEKSVPDRDRVQDHILIGADPEFVLVKPNGRIASASRFFGAGVGSAAGADAMLVGRRLVYPVAELRPEPAASSAALAANMRRLLLRAAQRISDPTLRWAAGAMPVPGLALGGHIHLSGAPLTSRLLRLMDSCIAFPLALVEDPAGRGRRPRYGRLGDYRLQPHGGFEYRTLPSWLVSPAAAKAAFALALLCAREAWSLSDLPAHTERYVEAYYAGDRAELAGCLDELASSLAATRSYAALSAYIEPLFTAARRGMTWDESADIRVKWKIPMTT